MLAKTKTIILIAILSIAFVAACLEEQKDPILYIQVSGHGAYEFTNNVRESIEVPVNDPQTVKALIDNSKKIVIVFDGSDEEDNARFQVSILNTIFKLQDYYAHEGKLLDDFDSYYYIGDRWYNKTNDFVDELHLESDTVLWFKGPNTGAEETSVKIDRNVIFIEGKTGKGIELAADRFILAVFGVNRIEE